MSKDVKCEHEHEHDCCCGHDHEHEHEQHHHDHEHSTDDIKKDIIFIVTSAVLTLVGVLFLEGIAKTIVLLAAYLIVGGEILWNALKGLLRGNIVDENVLMSVATAKA